MENKKVIWHAIDPNAYTTKEMIHMYDQARESSLTLIKIRESIKVKGLPTDSLDLSIHHLGEAEHLLFMACYKKYAQQIEKKVIQKASTEIPFRESWQGWHRVYAFFRQLCHAFNHR